MATDLLVEGVQLMVAGMGAVFVFLTLLVLATSLMSQLVMRFQPVAAEPEVTADSEVSGSEVAAIAAAIAEHRRSGR
ncbi:MAG: OadG family protein [Gammaproteobacteria bacterium]|nr:OadG family protein [Gammaproteobacteria bacterium]